LPEIIDFNTGVFVGKKPASERTLGQIASIYRDPSAITPALADKAVYRIYGDGGPDEAEPRLVRATTVLYSGNVGDEYFMTRGHYHVNPARGELSIVLGGQGLMMCTRGGEPWVEGMFPGSLHDVPGDVAHRAVNTGKKPLVFLTVWLADCGHNYEAIARDGFGGRVVRTLDGPKLVFD
jgi:glucose-6-phosphate isomerase